jgi:hypothetical protein
VADADDEHPDLLVLDLGDHAAVADAVFSEAAEPVALQRLTHCSRVAGVVEDVGGSR